jgi:hypothetical protein
MRTVKNLTGALVMAGMVAGALVVSVTPAAAQPADGSKGFIMFCSAIQTAASSAKSSVAASILQSLFDSVCG